MWPKNEQNMTPEMSKSTPRKHTKTCPKMSKKKGPKWGQKMALIWRVKNRPYFGGIQDMSKNKHQNVAKIGRFWPVFQNCQFGGQNRGQFWVVFGVHFGVFLSTCFWGVLTHGF